MEEEWKKIPDYNNYSCSSLSRIRNDFNGKILDPKPDVNSGYITVGIPNNSGKKKHTGIHRLIAETWLPNPENKPTVNHKNKDKIRPKYEIRKINVYNKERKLIDTCNTKIEDAIKYKINRDTVAAQCNNKIKKILTAYKFSYAS
jgi:hypothetical protein